jgi:hypothetical protein
LDERIIELLMHKQKLITITVDEARTPATTTSDTLDEEIRAMVAAANEEVRLASEPRAEAIEEAPKTNPKWRQPQTEQEEWAKQAIITLCVLDPDRAAERNMAGWDILTGPIGHSLHNQLNARGGLTNAQWTLAIEICKKFHGQVGRCPGDEDQNAAE